MPHKDTGRGCFNGAHWFEQQVRSRTCAAMRERGSTAAPHSAEYRAEYERQLLLFRAERAAVKRRKAELYAQRMKEKAESGSRSGC